MDALANYITALGYGSDAPEDQQRFARYWPADLQLVGKEIIRFHCVYWPAFLMAAGLPLPKSVAANGWLLFEQSKMSKSRGNVVRAETIIETLGADALRYFLMREVVFGQDGSFSFDALVQRYNADLANGYGNLTSRVLAMITQYFDGVIPAGRLRPAGCGGRGNSGARVRPAFRRAGFFPRARVLVGTGRRGRRLHHRKGSLEAGGRRGRTGPQGIDSVHLRRSASYHYRAGLSCAARGRGEDMGAAWVWAILPRRISKSVRGGNCRRAPNSGQSGPVFPRAEKDTVKRMQELETNNAGKSVEAEAEPTSEAARHDQRSGFPDAGAATDDCGPVRGRCGIEGDRGHRLPRRRQH